MRAATHVKGCLSKGKMIRPEFSWASLESLRPATSAMGMASLKELRLRIRSMKNIEKITSSMKLVAAAKLKKAQDAAESARPFLQSINQGFLEKYPTDIDRADKENKHLVVIVTSDKGLCGSINANLIREVERLQRAEFPENLFSTATLGLKGIAAIRSSKILGGASRFQFGAYEINKKPLTFLEASAMVEQTLECDFDVLTFQYNKFVSSIEFNITSVVFPSPAKFAEQEKADVDYELEGGKTEILKDLYEFSLASAYFVGMMENQASELGARMTSMDAASTNAGDVAESLSRQYSTIRQAAITTELSEIISGAEAVTNG